MQELQPEIKKIQEKYKKDLEARTKAQQELFRKHNYNPLGGCLVMFIQLPIFIGLYRGLMVDVELRQAPLFSEAIRWCSNLAAPDMFFDWSGFMPGFINEGIGLFGLGPYFNILPLATVALFLAQQKMLMPPPADDQARMQQNIMKYMMIFMGVLFFKVASGLCIYFIASSLWGLAERKLLPKPRPATPAGKPESRPQAKPQPRPQVKSPPQQTTTGGGDGAAPRRKKRKSKRGKR
jgi:YidC/Oxa1 family membrane protein insertase